MVIQTLPFADLAVGSEFVTDNQLHHEYRLLSAFAG